MAYLPLATLPIFIYIQPMLSTLIWLSLAALYSPIFLQLYRSRWEFIDYTHAYFILPVSLWLAWRQRKTLFLQDHPDRHCEEAAAGGRRSNPSSLPLALLILGLLMFLFGWRLDYLFITTLSLIPVLFGLTGYLYGPQTAKALAFPILYLLLLVPPPLGILDAITIPMRYGISVLSAAVLNLLHYPVTRDGLLISLGGHEIYMGAPCSGFRSLITMIALGLPFAYVNKGTFKKKAILVSSVIPLALLGNFIRVLSVCLVTYHFGESIGAKYHDASGFVIFLVLIGGLIGIEKLLNPPSRDMTCSTPGVNPRG
jgi:exosortase